MTGLNGLRRPRKPLPALPLATSLGQDAYQLPESLSQLHYYATLFQQLHVRHKNQHRGQLWFKQLNLLRRALRDLLDTELQLLDLQRVQHSSQNSAEDVRKKFERERQLRSRNDRLREWIREVLIPECYVRFSVLVADGDGGFANLGVVLVAAVAGLAAVVGLPKQTDDDVTGEPASGIAAGTERAEDLKQTIARDEVGHGGGGGGGQGEPEAAMEPGDDFGTVVERTKLPESFPGIEGEGIAAKEEEQDVGGVVEQEDADATDTGTRRDYDAQAFSKYTKGKRKPDTTMEAASHEASPAPSRVKLRKKTRRKNAIDDLFEGFA